MLDESDVKPPVVTEIDTEPPVLTPPPPKTDFEAGYKGLQRKLDRLQKEHDAIQEKYESLAEESEGHKQSKRSVEQEKDALAKEKLDLDLKVKEYEVQLANQNLRNERFNLIMTEYPELASFETAGLLPDAPDIEALKGKLTKFRETLGAKSKAELEDAVKGAGAGAGAGNTGAGTGKRSKETVYSELVALAGNTKTPENKAKYDTLMKEWIALN